MDWSEEEVGLIIEDYFSMLQKQMRNIPYNKSEHRRSLREKINRTDGSIEFKHRNISAILELLGFEILTGYLPAMNYQSLLASKIEQAISKSGVDSPEATTAANGFGEARELFTEQPPDKLLIPTDTPEFIKRLIKKFDPAQRDLKNRQLGEAGERTMFEYEIDFLMKSNRVDLAKKVEWTSQERGDGAGYDIKSFALDGTETFIEVKTTNGAKRTPFYISDNELEFSREAAHRYRLRRLYDFRKEARLYELNAPLDDFIFLAPVVYRAGFEGA
jgi:hypothetical protein